MAHVYNPRGWQRAPGSSLASQSRLTEGPQVPGRPTLFFFKQWLSQGWFLTSTCMHPYTHICTHNLCTPLVHTKKHYPGINRQQRDLKLFIVCSQNLLLICLFGGGGGVCVYSLIYPRLALNSLCMEDDAEVLLLLPPPPSAGSQHSLHPVYMVLRLEPRVSFMSDNTLPTQLHSQSWIWFFKPQTKSKAGFSHFIHLNIAGKRQHNDLKSPLFLSRHNSWHFKIYVPE